MSFYKVTGEYCNFIFERCIGSSKSVRRNLYAVVVIFTKNVDEKLLLKWIGRIEEKGYSGWWWLLMACKQKRKAHVTICRKKGKIDLVRIEYLQKLNFVTSISTSKTKTFIKLK